MLTPSRWSSGFKDAAEAFSGLITTLLHGVPAASPMALLLGACARLVTISGD